MVTPVLRTAEIVAVGSELLTPTRQDTNSLAITATLNALGIEVRAKAIVGDRRDDLSAIVRGALARADALVLCGGLGPTDDDLTRDPRRERAAPSSDATPAKARTSATPAKARTSDGPAKARTSDEPVKTRASDERSKRRADDAPRDRPRSLRKRRRAHPPKPEQVRPREVPYYRPAWPLM